MYIFIFIIFEFNSGQPFWCITTLLEASIQRIYAEVHFELWIKYAETHLELKYILFVFVPALHYSTPTVENHWSKWSGGGGGAGRERWAQVKEMKMDYMIYFNESSFRNEDFILIKYWLRVEAKWMWNRHFQSYKHHTRVNRLLECLPFIINPRIRASKHQQI